MRRHAATRTVEVCLACIAAIAFPKGVAAQDLGQIFVSVGTRAGAPVTDLTSEEFSFTEDGREVEIVSAQVGTAPMKIALLVDNGDRVNELGGALNSLRAGLSAFIETLPPQHLVSLFTIGGQLKWRVDFTTDRAELLEAAESVFPDPGSGVLVLDGIRETWERWFEGDEAWPVFVLVVTDGVEGSAFMNDDRYLDFIDTLRHAGVIIHVVQMNVSSTTSRAHRSVRTRGGSPITNLALNLTDNTGGRYMSIGSPTALAGELTKLATDMGILHEEVSHRYRLVWQRRDPDGARLSVTVARPGVGVRLYGDRRLP